MENPKQRRFAYIQLQKQPCQIKKKKGLKKRRFDGIQQIHFLPPTVFSLQPIAQGNPKLLKPRVLSNNIDLKKKRPKDGDKRKQAISIIELAKKKKKKKMFLTRKKATTSYGKTKTEDQKDPHSWKSHNSYLSSSLRSGELLS